MEGIIVIICFVCILGIIIPIVLSSMKLNYGNNFQNSYFSDLNKHCNTAMIIIPHQDDEINVAGAVIKNLVKSNCNVIVVFAINADIYNQTSKRTKEGINSCKVLGVKESNIYFLGYGNAWSQTKYTHIYHASSNELIFSSIGKKETYGTPEHPDYATKKHGCPSIYTRTNIINNIKDLIYDHLPEQIYCVDFDAHPDHRAVSLLFEEALCQILKETDDYYPEIYKGFAYSTAWLSINDFYHLNLPSTQKPLECHLQNPIYETDVPQYNWINRVRIPVCKNILTHSIVHNPISKALLKHRSQRAFGMASKVINSDAVFWQRSTNSITYKSKISASSGNVFFLNDFKLFDCLDITKISEVEYGNYLWMPDKNDDKKEVRIEFKNPQNINKVSLYNNFDLTSIILSGVLTFSDNSKVLVGPLNPNGSKKEVCFPTKKEISFLSFKILTYEGRAPGLTEIEVFSPNKKKEQIQIIKLLDKDNDMFIYRYFVKTGIEEVPLEIYQYPESLSYNTMIINQEESKAYLENEIIHFEKGFKYCKVRVELKDYNNIYDEVEFIQLNHWDIFIYNDLTYISKIATFLIKVYYRIRDYFYIQVK
ncbi:PIG-L family deacetylase [uncultured Bacteroides sp.]|uniref:PIG-L family deacetylase n=1 Tax=uncultured Bacteroides sp. TaxID=162156 RepID=UPI002AAB691A|nr:PIG-L family deacetylase [uncultured Bacteroides sp.]